MSGPVHRAGVFIPTTWRFCLVALSVIACNREPAPSGSGAVSNSATANRAEASLAVWEPGTQYRYRLDLWSRTAMADGPVILEIHLQSGLALDARPTDDAHRQVILQLLDPTLTIPNKNPSVASSDLEGLSQPFLAEYEEGRLEKVHGTPDASPLTRSVCQSVAATLQVRRQAGTGSTWQVEEQDATGTYLSEYRRGEKSGQLLREKLRYEKLTLDAAAKKAVPSSILPEVLSSEATLKFVANELRGIESIEKLKSLFSKEMPILSETRLSLIFEHKGVAEHRDDWEALAKLPDALIPGPVRHETNTESSDLAKISGRSYDEILAALMGDDLPVSNRTNDEISPDERKDQLRRDMKAFAAMAAYLRRHPESLDRTKLLVREGSPATRQLLDALSSAGTPAAQSAVCELVLDTSLPIETRAAGAHSLIRTKNPSEQTLKTLETLISSPQLNQHGLLGLGSFVRRLGEQGEQKRADSIMPLILAELQKSESRTERVLALRAIANSGHVSAFDAVEPLVNDKDRTIQGAAVEAMRLMHHPEVDAIIVKKLSLDEDPFVRQAALNAAKTRIPNENLIRAVGEVALKASDTASRKKAVRLLSEWRDRSPNIIGPFIESAAKQEQNPLVRSMAEKAL